MKGRGSGLNVLSKYLYHQIINSGDRWYPFISVYYLTYACDFRCPFCSDGSGKPYHQLPNDILPAAEVFRLMEVIRRKCDYIVITGGEPLVHPEFSMVMEGLKPLRFKDVILTTNGFELDRHLPVIAQSVNSLVVSLNTLNPLKASRLFGKEGNILSKILANIRLANEYPDKKYRIHISSVVTPENIEDLYEVYSFAQEQGFIFAACPQLAGVKAHEALAGNDSYRRFYDFLITEKKKGRRVFGTVKYLEQMRDLSKFDCRPFTMLVVSPVGDVYYPCLEIGHLAGNLLQNPDLHDIRHRGEDLFGPPPECDNRCHSACALGFATIFSHPAALLSEAWLQVKGQYVMKNHN